MKRYIEIANILRERITAKEYPVGNKIPYEHQLCEEFACTKITMKKALNILVQEGYITRRRGSGTIVKTSTVPTQTSLQYGNFLLGFTTIYGADRMSNTVITFEITHPDEEIANRLELNETEYVYHFLRVRTIDNIPVSTEETWIPIKILPEFTINDAAGSIYQYVDSKLHMIPKSSHVSFRALPSNELEQEYLHLDVSEPVAETKAISYLNDGQAFEFSITHHHYKHFDFKTVVTREQ